MKLTPLIITCFSLGFLTASLTSRPEDVAAAAWPHLKTTALGKSSPSTLFKRFPLWSWSSSKPKVSWNKDKGTKKFLKLEDQEVQDFWKTHTHGVLRDQGFDKGKVKMRGGQIDAPLLHEKPYQAEVTVSPRFKGASRVTIDQNGNLDPVAPKPLELYEKWKQSRWQKKHPSDD